MEKVVLINVFVTLCLFSDINARPAKPNCPPDKPKVYCFVDPCDESSCAVTGATCRSTSCGGCLAIWSDSSGAKLYDEQCTTKAPTTTRTTPPTTTASTTPKPTTVKQTTPSTHTYINITTTLEPLTITEELGLQLQKQL